MKRVTLTLCAAAILFAACNNDKTASEETKTASDSLKTASADAKPADNTPMPDSATMAKNWEAYMTPGNEHKMMASWDGTWDAAITLWQPGYPVQTTTGTTVNKMAMGGRYQMSSHKGNIMGAPFEGMGTLAFDNSKKVFESTWIDNMGTGIMHLSGPWDDATKTMTLTGPMVEPATGKEIKVKETFKVDDANTQTMAMFAPGPDGKEMKTMEIKFTRKK